MGTALAQMTQHLGFIDTVWALQFLASWGDAVRANGWEPIDPEQYAAHWRISRAKGFRDRQKWRALFPGEDDPNVRVLAARTAYEAAMAEAGQKPSRDSFAAFLGSLPAA